MNAKDRDELMIELRTAMLGVKGTEDNGMAGDMKEIKKRLDKLNGSVQKNTAWRKVLVTIGGAIIAWFVKVEIG